MEQSATKRLGSSRRQFSRIDEFLRLATIRAVYLDLLTILAAWLILVASMLVLQALGLDFGFDVWPMGEFRNWVAFLQSDVYGAPKRSWAVDNRNPLSPWWYNAARPLIAATPAAPLILQLVAALFVGFAAYLLMAELARSRRFGLSVGIVSAVFIATPYSDGVAWNFIAALGCTLLCIWLFALFSKDRSKIGYLAASYLVWFVAITTYTLQVGAMAAVFFVSLRDRLRFLSWPRAVSGAAVDALPYAALLVLFLMIWITTSSAGVPGAFTFQFSVSAAIRSLAAGIWNFYYEWFWTLLTDAGLWLMASFAIFLTLFFFLLLQTMKAGNDSRPAWRALCFASLIACCIAAPTVALEATSDIWTPGTRWPMLMPFWSPFLLGVLVFSVLWLLPEHLWPLSWRSLLAGTAAFAIVLSLGVNRFQVLTTRRERGFFQELQSIVTQDRLSGATFPRRYLIWLDKPAYFIPSGFRADSYAQTLFGHDVTFRMVETLPDRTAQDSILLWRDQHLKRQAP